LDPRFLADFCDASGKLVNTCENRSIVLTVPRDPEKPMLVRSKSCEGGKLACVIMPLASDDGSRVDAGQWHVGYGHHGGDPLDQARSKACDLLLDAYRAQAYARRMEGLYARALNTAEDYDVLGAAASEARDKADLLEKAAKSADAEFERLYKRAIEAKRKQEAAEAAALAEADEHELVEEASPELAESDTILEPDTAMEPVGA
jgi:GH24 family phage-related lysozyme (muramidase)